MLRCMVTSRSEKHIVLDLEGVLGVDAAGIGAMVELKQWSSLQGRSLSLANVNGNIMRLLRIVGVDGLISVKAPKDSEASQPHAADELLARMMHAMSA